MILYFIYKNVVRVLYQLYMFPIKVCEPAWLGLGLDLGKAVGLALTNTKKIYLNKPQTLKAAQTSSDVSVNYLI